MKLKFTREAIDDLSRLRRFLAEHNPNAAERTAKELLLGIEKLKVFPEIGLKVERAFDPHRIRDLFVEKYTIRYLIGKEEIIILRLWHGKEFEKDL